MTGTATLAKRPGLRSAPALARLRAQPLEGLLHLVHEGVSPLEDVVHLLVLPLAVVRTPYSRATHPARLTGESIGSKPFLENRGWFRPGSRGSKPNFSLKSGSIV